MEMLSVALAALEEMAATVALAAQVELALVAMLEIQTLKLTTKATVVAMAATDLAVTAATVAMAELVGRLMAARQLAAMAATGSG